jgi:hypothetical protein
MAYSFADEIGIAPPSADPLVGGTAAVVRGVSALKACAPGQDRAGRPFYHISVLPEIGLHEPLFNRKLLKNIQI